MSFLSTVAHLIGRLRGWLNEPVGERGVEERASGGEGGALGPLDDDLLGFDDVGGYRDGGEDFE